MSMKAGSLFSGYGGLDMAVEDVLGATTVWHCEWDDAPSRVLAHHWPGTPNCRDVTAVDWASVEPVDIITGGSPCQDLSTAGKRTGMAEGTRSNLWVHMREAITQLRPTYVVWENVKGALSATAVSDSDVEPGPRLLGDGGGHLRALGRVLGDLADLGYDAQWATVRASDVGAPHHRARVFLLATPADPHGESGGFYDWDVSRVAHTRRFRRRQGPQQPVSGAAALPAPECGVGIPADATNDGCARAWQARHGSAGPADRGSRGVEWGPYAPAIRRWERVMGPAPAPTEPNSKGRPRLNAAFAEWMMGLPAGWVTDPAIGLTRSQQLKAIGNGVCPPQAAAAINHLAASAKATTHQ